MKSRPKWKEKNRKVVKVRKEREDREEGRERGGERGLVARSIIQTGPNKATSSNKRRCPGDTSNSNEKNTQTSNNSDKQQHFNT